MAVNVKILLVDDNATVLAMLQKALASPVTTIFTETDATDALMRAIDEPFDLVITDFQMPGMDGQQLLEKLKLRPSTASVPVVLMASKADLAEKLRSRARDTVEDFVEKPFFLRDASRRIKRIVDKIALEKMASEAPASDGILRGTLEQMNVIDLLQSLELGRKSCRLTFTRNVERCDLYFHEGQISHAVYGDLKGDAAAFRVTSWTEGNFQIDFHGRTQEQSTTLSTQALLMEGLRMLDEANHETEETATEEAAPEPQPATHSAAEEDNILET